MGEWGRGRYNWRIRGREINRRMREREREINERMRYKLQNE